VERLGVVKAIAAASLALHDDGTHRVSLDSVVAAHAPDRRRHAVEIQGDEFGGLAVNFVEC
jgi:L-serine dehydratase